MSQKSQLDGALRAIIAAVRVWLPIMLLSITLLLIVIAALAKDKPWPCSQCRNGWVDAMTGMCPPRPSCKASRH
jgi:hypothetical protein